MVSTHHQLPHEARRDYSLTELLLSAALMFLLTNAVFPLIAQGRPDFDIDLVAPDNPALQIASLAGYLCIGVFAFRRIAAFGDALLGVRALCALLGLIAVSPLWSWDPTLSARRSAGVVLAALFGVYLAVTFPVKLVLNMLLWVLGV